MKRSIYSTGRTITFQAPSSFKVFLLPKISFFPINFELKVGKIALQVTMLGLHIFVAVVLRPPCPVVSRRGHAAKMMSSTWRHR
jgi:hypothetical protein